MLVEDFCQQYPSHSVGGLAFGPGRRLYASAGDGASFNYADERPTATRTENPCADPFEEGGSIRSQDLRTSGDPLGLDGSILALDPDVPLANTDLARTAAMIGHGMRNPFRITVRPGTSEVWAADVGWNRWEEIDRLQPGGVRNFGWPCYEGSARMGTWDALDNPVCEGLYAAGPAAHTAPHYAYDHGAKVVPGESCPMRDLVDLGARLLRRRDVPRRVRRRPVLRRLRAPLRLGDAARGERPARPGADPHVHHRRGRRRPAGRSRRRPLLRRHRRADRPPRAGGGRQPGADRARLRDARPRPVAAHRRSSTGAPPAIPTARRSPTPGTPTSTGSTTAPARS